MRFSLNVFGDHAYPVVDHLEEPATYGEAANGFGPAHYQRTLAQQRHERCVVRQDTDLTVESGCNDGIRFTVEHRRFGRDYSDLHHPVASCLARAITSSILPCM